VFAVNFRVAYIPRKNTISIKQFNRAASQNITNELKDVMREIQHTIEEEDIMQYTRLWDAFHPGNTDARKVTISKNVVRGFLVWPKSVRHYGPIQEFGTREGGYPVKAVPSTQTLAVWLHMKFGYDMFSASTARIASKIKGNIARFGIPSNLNFDHRGFVSRAIRRRSGLIRRNLVKWSSANARRLQIFPKRVLGIR
jgi:hypothetical protein